VTFTGSASFLHNSFTAAADTEYENKLALAGLDLVVTGALGHCPLYHKLGRVPQSLRRTA
jgi:Protein of unknown function (DUF2892)